MATWIFSLTIIGLALVTGVSCLTVSIPQDTYEYARGDNITLPCIFKSTLSTPPLVIITWIAEGVDGAEDVVILTYYSTPGRTDYDDTYEFRSKLDVNVATGKADLRLYSIGLNDNRRFLCRVQIPGDDNGKTSDPATLVVLVAPSTPICSVEGTAEYGQNVNLTCRSEEGSPPPTYTWDNRDVQNQPRPLPPKTTVRGGVLSLFNISKDTSGFFICTSANKIRSASCNLTLAVMPPSMLGSVAQTAGIIVRHGESGDGYYDKEANENGERRALRDGEREERDTRERRDYDDRRSDYDDRRSDYDDRRSDYNDRRRDYDDRRSDSMIDVRLHDRRSDYDDRRSDYDDRRSDYTERRSDYDDRRSDYSDRRDRNDQRDCRYDDERRDNSRDRRYDDDRDDRPPVPSNKPPRRD
ncbi:hypothetical protein WMY93_013158 [Mugilogobius chulae]|uniref:Ig-like domain-containing protein n=1 Tax=Mugilogobius chulae TaxID=88201 RepID=A0AAW0P8D0_9GOBI